MKESFWNGIEGGNKDFIGYPSGVSSGWGRIFSDGMGQGIADGKGDSEKTGVI